MNTEKLYAESIAKDYSPKETSKIRALKKLDAKAKLPAIVFTYSFGINAALVFGLGMCLAMRVIGTTGVHFAMGIGLGLLGMAGCVVNYPIYKKIINKGKEKYGYEIIELARQISEQ